MKRNILIVDSNAEHVNWVIKLTFEVTENVKIYTAYNIADAYKLLMEITIDVFILDIALDRKYPDDTSGIRLIEKIRQIPKYVLTPVIFITTEKDPAMYAYIELNCIGYITKPCSASEFKKIFEKAVSSRTKRDGDKVMAIRRDGSLYPLKLKEIIYTESFSHVLHIHLKDGSVLSAPYKTCSSFLQEADVDFLIQCSRGVLVNRNWVMGINMSENILYLRNNMGKLNIGRTYRKIVREEILYRSQYLRCSEEKTT